MLVKQLNLICHSCKSLIYNVRLRIGRQRQKNTSRSKFKLFEEKKFEVFLLGHVNMEELILKN